MLKRLDHNNYDEENKNHIGCNGIHYESLETPFVSTYCDTCVRSISNIQADTDCDLIYSVCCLATNSRSCFYVVANSSPQPTSMPTSMPTSNDLSFCSRLKFILVQI